MKTYDDLPPMVRAVTEMHLTGSIVPAAIMELGMEPGSETGGLV
jgi:hypothetical protein